MGSPLFAQPVVTSFLPTSAAVGAKVIIYGGRFSATASDNIVYFGGVQASVNAATSTALTVTVPAGATYNYITVTTNQLTAYSPQPFTVIAGSTLTSTSFSFRVPFTVTGTYPSGMNIVDLDGDGKLDLVAANFTSNDISVFQNVSVVGTVQMKAEQKWKTGVDPEGLAVGDLNGDGKPDLAIASIDDHIISIFINTSSGGTISFANRIDISQGPNGWSRGLAISDVDKDGKPDLIAADNNKIYDLNNSSYGTVSVYLNTSVGGAVSFASPVVVKTGTYPRRIAAGDLDGDNLPDLVVSNNEVGSVSVFRNISTPGNVAFASMQGFLTGQYPEVIALGDLNGDGKPEMAVVNYGASTVSVFKNISVLGTVSFDSKMDIQAATPLGVAIGDVTGDGKPDLVTSAFGSGNASVFQNTSSGGNLSFAANKNYSSGSTPIFLAIGDIDGDGLPDISITNGEANVMSVIKIPPGAIQVNLGDDTTLCQGDSLTLTANIPNGQYLWSTGESGNSIVVKQPGSYWVKATSSAGTASDTIQVSFNPPPVFDLGDDTVLCAGQKLILQPGVAASSWLWQDGSRNDSLVVTQPGTYWVQVTRNVCTVGDTIEISYKPLPSIDLGHNTAICKGSAIELDASAPGASYLWSNGASTATIDVSSNGLYWVAVTKDGCVARDSIRISYLVLPASLLGNDTTLCEGQVLVLKPAVQNASFLWQDGSTEPTFTVTQPGTYSVTVTDACESKSDAITVRRGLCQLIMPNAFTPNGDGHNDVFRVKDPSFIKTFDMQVFNRWGQVVYSSKDPYKGWDGYLDGSRLPSGTYVWNILLTDISGTTRRFKGVVILVD